METNLIGKNSILPSRPQISEPIQSDDLEVLERSADLDVLGLLDERNKVRSLISVMRTLVRKMGAAAAFDKRVDSVDGDRADRVVIFPRRGVVIQSFPLAKVLDWHGGQSEPRRKSGED